MTYQQLLSLLKSCNQNDLSIDSAGRLIIRMNDNRRPDHSVIHKKQFDAKFNIVPTLLYPDDRVIRKNLLHWTYQLIEKLHLADRPGVNHGELAAIFNLSALILCLNGQIDRAAALSHKQISYCLELAKENPALIKYIMQAWVNLSRIDRIKANCAAAISKLNELEQVFKQEQNQLGSYKLDSELFRNEVTNDREINDALQACLIIEPIKTYLYFKDAAAMLESVKRSPIPKQLVGFAYEAKIIAHSYLGNYHEALKLTHDAQQAVASKHMHLFLFRQAEIYARYDAKAAMAIFDKLVDLVQDYSVSSASIHHAYFAMQLSRHLHYLGCIKMAELVCHKALLIARALEDEPLLIESLSFLNAIKQPKILEDELKQLLIHTSYAMIINNYADHFSLNFNLTAIQHATNHLYHSLMSL